MKLLVAADPWVPSEKTGCPGIAISPGTQVLKVPQGLLVSHASQYLPRITMLWTVKDGDAGELSSEVTLTLLSGSLDSRRGKSAILNFKSFLRSSSPFTSSSAEWDIVKASLGSSAYSVSWPQHPLCLLLSFLPWRVSAAWHPSTWAQVLLLLLESLLACS